MKTPPLHEPVATFDGYDGESLKPVFTLIGTLNAGDKLCVCAPAQAAAPSDLQALKTLALAAADDVQPYSEQRRAIRSFELLRSQITPAVVLDLIARLASAEQAKAYEQRHAAESEIALAEVHAQLARQQAAPAAIPEDFVLMPTRLTAENGAKCALSGEFKESVKVTCHECGGSGDDPEFDGESTEHGSACSECNGEGTIEQDVAVGWDTIKDIYASAVKRLAAAPAHPAMPALLDKPQAEPSVGLSKLERFNSTYRGFEVHSEGELVYFAEVESLLADVRDVVLEEAAQVAESQNRVGYEWVKDSVWDNIIKRVPAAIRALKRAAQPNIQEAGNA